MRHEDRNSTALRYPLSDHLSSARGEADENQSEAGQRRYLPFGGDRPVPGAADLGTDERYTGQKRFESGGGSERLELYHYGARWYLPGVGIFTQPDSVVPDYKNPQSFNRYAYALGNPMRHKDPSGHYATWGDDDSGAGSGNPDEMWPATPTETPSVVVTQTPTPPTPSGTPTPEADVYMYPSDPVPTPTPSATATPTHSGTPAPSAAPTPVRGDDFVPGGDLALPVQFDLDGATLYVDYTYDQSLLECQLQGGLVQRTCLSWEKATSITAAEEAYAGLALPLP